MRISKHARAIALALTLGAAGALAGCATQPPSYQAEEVATASGKVVGINRANRTVSVMGPEGNVLVVKVGKGAQNFDRIRVGDIVRLDYYESVAVYVSSDGKPPEAEVAAVALAAPKGQMPAGEVVEVTDVSATIQSINPVKRVLRLKGPAGNVFEVKVDKSVQGFGQLKVGDNVHVRHTEAIAVTVSRP